MSNQSNHDIRLEAAACKLWYSNRGWEIVDDAMQIRGGRGAIRAQRRVVAWPAPREQSGHGRGGAALPTVLDEMPTTNAIENLIGSIRKVSKNVQRWRSGEMIRRWITLGVVTADKKFRRIKGCRGMGTLLHPH